MGVALLMFTAVLRTAGIFRRPRLHRESLQGVAWSGALVLGPQPTADTQAADLCDA